MSGIPHRPNIVSQEQLVGSMMPKITIIICKLGTEVEPSRRKNQFENGQATHHKAMTTQVGKCIDQIYEDMNKATRPISKPQMMYTTLFMATQANRYVGWPPPIPLNCQRQRTSSVVNTKARGSVAKPY